jgi:hypothetical protein
MLLSYENMTRPEVVQMMVKHLGVDARDAWKEINDTKGGHARYSHLKRVFKERLLEQNEAYNEDDKVVMQQLREQSLCIYLLYLLSVYICSCPAMDLNR